MPEDVSFLAFSCTHCPLHDEEAVEWMIDAIGQRRPDVIVHLGDGHEADSASRWPSEYDWPLKEEFQAHNALLERINKAAPDARKVFIPGNHDANLLAINRIDPKLRSLCDYRDHEPALAEWEQPVRHVYSRREGVFRLGQVAFTHGFESNVSAGETQAIKLADPYGLLVHGHTHRPHELRQAKKTARVSLPWWYINPGTLRDIWEVPYMERRDSSPWGQGIVVGRAQVVKSPRLSRCWEADLITFRMFDDK